MPEENQPSQIEKEELDRIMKLWRSKAPEGVIITGPGHEIKLIGQKDPGGDESSTPE